MPRRNDLHIAAMNGNLEDVRNFINDEWINGKDEEEYTPLHYSAEQGYVDIVEALITAGANVNAIDAKGRTPLFCSSSGEVVRALVDAGADVNTGDYIDRTPLHCNENFEAVQALIAAGADVNRWDRNGTRPLHCINDADIVRTLIAAGASVDARDIYGKTPLHYQNEAEAVRNLVAAGADVNATDENGNTPLHYIKNVEIVKELIASGADINIKNGVRKTPLEMAYCEDEEDPDLADSFTFDEVQDDSDDSDDQDPDDSDDQDPDDLDDRDLYEQEEKYKYLIKYTMLHPSILNKPDFKSNNEGKLNELWNFWYECKKEKKILKKTFLGNSRVSFYQFLTEVDANKLANYLSGEIYGINSKLIRDSYLKKFPMFEEDIGAQFEKGIERANLLDQSQ